MMKSAFFCESQHNLDFVYAMGRQKRIGEMTDLFETTVNSENFEQLVPQLQGLDVIFSTWGMPKLNSEHLEKLPNLKAVFYAAGSVKAFAKPFLNNNISVISSWAANAIPVAEFTLAQILLATKDFFNNEQLCSASAEKRCTVVKPVHGNFGETVALLGAGMIGRYLIGLLKPFELNVIVWDPFLSHAQAAELGVEKVEKLEEAFQRALVVSNHLANVPETVRLLKGKHFELMRKDATFINTGRGATIDEAEMATVFGQRPDLLALLDVTYPEPPEATSPFYALENVRLTSHIAGSLGNEVVRMADFAIDEFCRFEKSEPLKYEVTQDMLKTMA